MADIIDNIVDSIEEAFAPAPAPAAPAPAAPAPAPAPAAPAPAAPDAPASLISLGNDDSHEEVEPEAEEAKEAKEAEAEAEPEAEEKPEKKGAKRQIPVPKDSASFFRARAKDPKAFAFTSDGNLQVPAMRDLSPKVIEIPSYRPSTSEELAMSEGVRYDKIKEVEREYDEKLRTLKEAMATWRATGASSEAIETQRELARLDALRTHLRSPLRWTVMNKRLTVRDVLVDNFYEVKKLKYPVYNLILRGNTFEDLVKVKGAGNAAVEAEAQPAVAEGEQEAFIFFGDPEDPDYGPLSPNTMIDFVFNSTMYTSPVQAYELERITRLGRRKDFGPLLLKERNPDRIRALALKIAGEIENPRELWIEILKTLLTQHPKYKDILESTGKSTLVYTNMKEKTIPAPRRWGIGLKADDPGALDRTQWQGPNTLGQAWQAVRGSLEKEEEDNSQEGGFKESGQTSEEIRKRRSGVLMGYYRRNKAH
jgi:predicted NAD-dependent protein-ADP-ribosyltransferase YbiA (DUF1768 family)